MQKKINFKINPKTPKPLWYEMGLVASFGLVFSKSEADEDVKKKCVAPPLFVIFEKESELALLLPLFYRKKIKLILIIKNINREKLIYKILNQLQLFLKVKVRRHELPYNILIQNI